MAKMRVHEAAKQFNRSNKEIISFLEENNIAGKTHMSALEEDEVELITKAFGEKPKEKAGGQQPANEEKKPEKPDKSEKPEKQEKLEKSGNREPKKKSNVFQVSHPQNSRNPRNTAPGMKPARPGGARGEQGAKSGDSQAQATNRSKNSGRMGNASSPKPSQGGTGDGAAAARTPARSQGGAGDGAAAARTPARSQGGTGDGAAAARTPARSQGGTGDGAAAARTPAKPQGSRKGSGERKPAAMGKGNLAPSGKPVSRKTGNSNNQNGKSQDQAIEREERENKGSAHSRAASGKPVAKRDEGHVNGNKSQKQSQNAQNRNKKNEKHEKAEKPDNRQNTKPGKQNRPPQPTPPAPKEEETIRTIVLNDTMTIKELAEKMKVRPADVVKKLFMQGKVATINQEIDFDMAEEIALEYNCIAERVKKVDVIAELLKEEEEDESKMVQRPPVVCVMGHVDHGKTSLLDAIRDTNVIDKEAGGITQHIGAYVVSIKGQKITFLDTPGHEAFTAMRMRGANATDIAILVVAADDGVMPQTVEAINHAKAAGIEIIVAINKIDKASANIERVKQELSEHELISEEWGGSTIFVPVSAHTHEGIGQLLEMILLTAEICELKANPKRAARGLVIEAELDKGKGPVATVLVQKGTLKVGDPIAAGACHGKVRAMMDDKGRRVKEAGPSMPVEILGLSDVPNAGEIFMVRESEKDARSYAETFIKEGREKMLEDTRVRMSLDDLFSQIQAGNLKELNLIVKADVQGSVEALRQSLVKLSNEEVVVKVLHGGVGAINESDVTLASASNAIIIGFNVRPDAAARETADREGVDLRLYKVIYNAIEDVEAAMKGMLDPIFEEQILGHAEVRQTFKSSDVGMIAGSYVLDGVIRRGCQVRIRREDDQIFEGNLASLKRFKDDQKEVRAGYECGLVFEGFHDIQEGDQVEAYIMVEVPR